MTKRANILITATALLAGLLAPVQGAAAATASAMASAARYSESGVRPSYQRRDFAGAQAYVEGWLRAEPDNATAWAHLGIVYDQGRHQSEQALRYFRKAVAIRPDYGQAWNAIAVIENRLGDDAAASEALRHARSGPEGSANAWQSRIFQLSQAGDHAGAVNATGRFAASLQGSANEHALYVLGNDYNQLGEYDKAAATYTQVLRLDPRNARAWNNRGAVEQRMGQDGAAMDDFRRAAGLGDPLGEANAISLANAQRAQAAQRRAPFDLAARIRAAQENENLQNCGRYSC